MTALNEQNMAEIVTKRIYENNPELWERYGEKGWNKCIEDNIHHIQHLETTYELGDSKFFTDYATWLDGILQKFGMQTKLLVENFSIIIDALKETNGIDHNRKMTYIHYLDEAKVILLNNE